jgi:2-polyprenyl-3-methyl-5-hydroxy-6-metoxy-1,4-benzoquinol methylase
MRVVARGYSMVESKAWNWEEVKDAFWNEPSEDVYYYVHRWKERGYSKILDLGCGKGRHSIMFAQNGFDVSSLDLSESGIRSLKETADSKGLNIRCDLADMRELPYGNEEFDCILAYHAIYHTDTSSMECIISEMKRVLKNEGEIFVTFNSKKNPSFKDSRHERIDNNSIIKKEGIEKDIPHYYADSEDIIRLLYGFKFITLRQIEDIYKGGNGWHYFIHAKKVCD